MSSEESQKFDEAIAEIRRAIEIDPSLPEAHNELGMMLARRNDLTEAGHCFRKVIALRPDFAEAHHNLANVLREQGRLEQAIASYEAALAINPGLFSSYCSLGNCLGRLGRLDEAIVACRKAIGIRPDYAQAWAELGNVYYERNDPDQAIAHYLTALRHQPRMAEIYHALGGATLIQGNADRAIALCQRTLELKGDHARAHHLRLYAMLFSPSYSAEMIRTACEDFAARFETPLKSLWPQHTNRPDPERRLKIGYVSADLRNHSVAFFLEPILEHHDRERFEVYCYDSNAVALRDAITDRLAARAEHWISCQELSDAQLAERIGSDGIDILIDLAGHTRGNRLLAFARKPAPVQVTYLGYPSTTGLTAIDYRLTNWNADPQGAQAWHSERLYRLPRTSWCYRPNEGEMPEGSPSVDTSKGAGPFGDSPIAFGCTNNFAKVSPAAMALWSEILRSVPGSRLVMTSVPKGSARSSLQERFAAHGVDPSRLILHERLPLDRFRALAGEIDIALDPFPYTGTTTTCEALWMGIPVVTLIGDASVSRSGYALLETVGLSELCARDAAEYARIAIGLARDQPRLRSLKANLRRLFERSPLRDEAGITQDIEQAYREMWRDWCRSRP
jgi:protein O-GlcNAc transferase